jgi:hypothetical protein
MKPWQRVLLGVASLAALYVLWRNPPAGIATVLLGVCAVFLARGMHRSGFVANPLGDTRDYSVRPVLADLSRFIVLLGAGFLWVALAAYAIRLKRIPDTWVGVSLGIGPGLALLLLGIVYLGKAMLRFQFGGTPPNAK